MNPKVAAVLNRVAKWRSVFAGWQLGTRKDDDPESQAVRDHREITMMLRIESSALVGILLRKGIITQEEWEEALIQEAEWLDKQYQERFPGFEATDHGMAMDLAKIQESGTMKGWRP